MSYGPYQNLVSGLWFYAYQRQHTRESLGGGSMQILSSPVGYCGRGDIWCGGHPTPEVAEACFALYLAKEHTTLGVGFAWPTQPCEDELHTDLAKHLVQKHPKLLGWLPPAAKRAAITLGRTTIPLCNKHMNAPAVMQVLLKRGLDKVMEGR